MRRSTLLAACLYTAAIFFVVAPDGLCFYFHQPLTAG